MGETTTKKNGNSRVIVNQAVLDKFGSTLANIRKGENQSQEDVGEKMGGKQQGYISILENDEKPNPNLNTLVNYLQSVGWRVVLEKE